jgi:EAL domain-containing protein (putative c-di-GMP-specific phosphodiesterase class I)
MHKVLGHLTNFSLNKLSDKFVNTHDIQQQEEASKRTLSSLMSTLAEKGIDTQHVFAQIKETCAKALVAVQPFILQE